MNFYYKKNKNTGAAALVSTVIVSSVMLSVVLSLLLVSFNIREGMFSFSDSVQGFYSAEGGVSEALFQLRKQPNNFTFEDIVIGGIPVSRDFIEESCGGSGCVTNIQATASTTRATRKVHYSCTNEISDCVWSELVP